MHAPHSRASRAFGHYAAEVAAYCERTGRLPSRNSQEAEEKHMAMWLAALRRDYHNEKLSSGTVDKLKTPRKLVKQAVKKWDLAGRTD